jgi:hypothetical protein
MVLIEAEIDELLTAENLKTKKPRTWRGFPVLSCFLTNNLDLLAELQVRDKIVSHHTILLTGKFTGYITKYHY